MASAIPYTRSSLQVEVALSCVAHASMAYMVYEAFSFDIVQQVSCSHPPGPAQRLAARPDHHLRRRAH